MREAAAKQPMALQNSSAMMMLVMIVAPVVEPVAHSKIRMNAGTGDGAVSISMMSGALNRTAKSMPNARQPLIPRLRSMERATSTLAFRTSSDIYRRSDTGSSCWRAYLRGLVNLYPQTLERYLEAQRRRPGPYCANRPNCRMS